MAMMASLVAQFACVDLDGFDFFIGDGDLVFVENLCERFDGHENSNVIPADAGI